MRKLLSKLNFRGWDVGDVLVFVLTVLAIVVLTLFLIAFARPYDKLRIDAPEDGYELMGVSEYTEDGIPVVREGTPHLMYQTEICNDAVDVEVTRWVDEYGRRLGNAIDLPDERSSAILIETQQIFRADDEPFCTGVVDVRTPLPTDLSAFRTGGLYTFRTANTYSPSVWTYDRTVTTMTERFWYVTADAPVPEPLDTE